MIWNVLVEGVDEEISYVRVLANSNSSSVYLNYLYRPIICAKVQSAIHFHSARLIFFHAKWTIRVIDISFDMQH